MPHDFCEEAYVKGAVLLLLLSWASLAAQTVAAQPFTITISALAPRIKAGADVRVIVTITNHTTQSVEENTIVSGMTSLDPNLVFEVRDARGNLVDKRLCEYPKRSRHNVNHTIISGATLTQEQNISDFYDVSQPGSYVVQVSRSPSPGSTSEVVRSNKLTIEVKAPTLKSRELSQSELAHRQ